MCYDDQAQPPIPAGEKGAVKSEELTLTAADGNQFMAFVALAEKSSAAQVLILPDVRGLHQFYKDLAVRFAEVGVSAIALDYFGRTAGISSRAEGFDFWPHVQQITLDGFFSDVSASLAALKDRAGAGKPITVGFCMGGTFSFLSGTQDLGLAGVVGFYSGLSRAFGDGQPLLERGSEVKIPALGLFGGADQGIPAEQVQQFEAGLAQAGIEHSIHIYDGAPHSFFDRRYEEFAEASADAWQKVLAFAHARAA